MADTVQTILITGATDGIGLALARLYAQQGHRLILHGRRPLDILSDPLFTPESYVRADLSAHDAAARIAAFCDVHGIEHLDLLIHNAGTGYYGPAAAQSAESVDQVLAVNLRAPIAITHALLPRVIAVRGKIVFVSSVVTAVPGPDYAVYTASKAGLEGFARSLRVELNGAAAVQVVRPGATRTGMHAKLGLGQETLAWEKFPPASAAALRIANSISKNKAAETVGLSNRALYFAGRNGRFFIDPLMRRRAGGVPTVIDASLGRTPLCVITGAADGIGRALALRYGRAGYRVLGIDVDAGRAAHTTRELRTAGVEAHFVQADLAQDDGLAAVGAALRADGPAAVFIHNAGINYVAPFTQSNPARQQRVLDVNLRAPLQLTPMLLRSDLLAADGALIFLSSLSKQVSYPGAAVYAASKDALAAYARSLRVALGTHRRVLTIFPGPTRTVHARRYSPDNSREASRMPPEALAEAIFAAAERGLAELVPGWGNRIFALAGHLLPGVTERAMRRSIFEKVTQPLE